MSNGDPWVAFFSPKFYLFVYLLKGNRGGVELWERGGEVEGGTSLEVVEEGKLQSGYNV